MVLLLVFMQLTRDLFAIAKFLYYNHIIISDSTDGNSDRFLTGYNDSMIGYEKIRV